MNAGNNEPASKAVEPLWGQWLGTAPRANGRPQLDLMLSIDFSRAPIGHLMVEEPEGVSLALEVNVARTGEALSGSAQKTLIAIDRDGKAIPSEGTKETRIPQTFTFQGSVDAANNISGTWATEIDAERPLTLEFQAERDARFDAARVVTWRDFTSRALTIGRSHKSLIFRGHACNKWPLSAKFFREGRRDVFGFDLEDIHKIRRVIEGHLNQRFDPANAEDFAVMASIAQHHGYPTPLMDWTHSPMIAAFFAFRNHPRRECLCSREQEHFARIYVYDTVAMPVGTPLTVAPDRRAVPLYPSPRHNARSTPQQAVHLFSKVRYPDGDFESRARGRGEWAFSWMDISEHEALDALKDLRQMGVTAGSLFPGLDGSFADLAASLSEGTR